jgi:hypothetical protein
MCVIGIRDFTLCGHHFPLPMDLPPPPDYPRHYPAPRFCPNVERLAATVRRFPLFDRCPNVALFDIFDRRYCDRCGFRIMEGELVDEPPEERPLREIIVREGRPIVRFLSAEAPAEEPAEPEDEEVIVVGADGVDKKKDKKRGKARNRRHRKKRGGQRRRKDDDVVDIVIPVPCCCTVM